MKEPVTDCQQKVLLPVFNSETFQLLVQAESMLT